MINEIQNTCLIVQLENNKTNHEFMNYSHDDKNIIISAGISMFQYGHRDISSSTDSKIKHIILEMETNHHDEIKKKEQDIQRIKSNGETELSKRILELQNSHAKSFQYLQTEIDSLTIANKKLREGDNWKEYQVLLDQYKQENEKRIIEQKDLYSSLLQSKETEINGKNQELGELRNTNIESIKISTSSSRKGKKGEDDVDEIVQKYFKNVDIENISTGEGARGDRIYHIDGIKIMAEMKSYSSKIQYNNKDRGVVKFIRDMEMNEDYQCGIMISLTSPIADKEKGVIKPMISPEYLDDGRPVIYIHPGENMSLLESDEFIFLGFITIISIVKSMKNSKKMHDLLKNTKVINNIISGLFKLKKDYSDARCDELRKAKQLVECIENRNQHSLIEHIEKLFTELLNDNHYCEQPLINDIINNIKN
tara:strand:+ start:916 stop:2184 length:1269 start_codon:yes stop_codon:yes gene_type:complete